MSKVINRHYTPILAGMMSAALIAATPVASVAAAEGHNGHRGAATSAEVALGQAPAHSGDRIIGGTTQSTDPTRDDYVGSPEVASPQDGMLGSAYGKGLTGKFSFNLGGITWRVPTGLIAHSIKGSGCRITRESARWEPVGGIVFGMCNWRITFQNRYGSKIYSTVRSKVHDGCSYIRRPYFAYEPNRTVKRGLQCARLYVNGYFRGEQCHSMSK
ncbi:hypothetical protein [Isoptericola sp. NPDC055881]